MSTLRPSITAGRELMTFLPERIVVRYALFTDYDESMIFNAHLMTASYALRQRPAPLLAIKLVLNMPSLDRGSFERYLTEGDERFLTEKVQDRLRPWEGADDGVPNFRAPWVSADPFVGLVYGGKQSGPRPCEKVPANDSRFLFYHGWIAAALTEQAAQANQTASRFGEIRKLSGMLDSLSHRFNQFVAEAQLQLCKTNPS